MIEFETFCYLQNQKTGCTFVEKFIRLFSTEGIVRSQKHASIVKYDPQKFYFINVRNPIDTYLSLFNYGLDGKGELYLRIVERGHVKLYQAGIKGFEVWLAFMLDPNNAGIVSKKRPKEIFDESGYVDVANKMGFLTYRFLRLAVVDFDDKIKQMSDDDLVAFYKKESILNNVIKNENLNAELINLVKDKLKHAFSNQLKALDWIENSAMINPSVRRDKVEEIHLTQDIKALIKSREHFIYKQFYPESLD